MKENKVCMECKYYNNDNSKLFNRCDLHHCAKQANDSCEYYISKVAESDDKDDRLFELEQRVTSLERIILRLL